jgi:hypothetical protein
MVRNLFEIENARNLLPNEIVNTFVPTNSFWRLLSPKNNIVLGARGSGKTELIKMLAHDHLSQFKNNRTRELISDKKFIGIYVSTRIEWVGGLKNKYWNSEAEAERFFQWRLNISTCASFLITLRSCLDTYISDPGMKARAEREICTNLYRTWSEGAVDDHYDTIIRLQQYLEDVEHEKQTQITRSRVSGKIVSPEDIVGVYFENELFLPLKRALVVASRVMDFPSHTVWLLCLDEAEFLEEYHHRILNTHLRGATGNLFFKIATTPYSHHTLDTNSNASLNAFHDFEYIYIDRDPNEMAPGDDGVLNFAREIFKKRSENSNPHFDWTRFENMLGPSVLLDPKSSDWGEDSQMIGLLKKHSNDKTISRAQKLMGTSGFKDAISRKMHGALLLKEAVSQLHGRSELSVYSGIRMATACTDGNPRRIIRIFNLFINEALRSGRSSVKDNRQTSLLMAFSKSTLSRVKSEPEIGHELYSFLEAAGNYMQDELHNKKIGTDQISSIEIDCLINDQEWQIIKNAVSLGLLYPNVNSNNGDQMPIKTGVFRLAYVLSPNFKILPRKGKPVGLSRFIRQVSLFT